MRHPLLFGAATISCSYYIPHVTPPDQHLTSTVLIRLAKSKRSLQLCNLSLHLFYISNHCCYSCCISPFVWIKHDPNLHCKVKLNALVKPEVKAMKKRDETERYVTLRERDPIGALVSNHWSITALMSPYLHYGFTI